MPRNPGLTDETPLAFNRHSCGRTVKIVLRDGKNPLQEGVAPDRDQFVKLVRTRMNAFGQLTRRTQSVCRTALGKSFENS